VLVSQVSYCPQEGFVFFDVIVLKMPQQRTCREFPGKLQSELSAVYKLDAAIGVGTKLIKGV
jgi:hypothetical protein